MSETCRVKGADGGMKGGGGMGLSVNIESQAYKLADRRKRAEEAACRTTVKQEPWLRLDGHAAGKNRMLKVILRCEALAGAGVGARQVRQRARRVHQTAKERDRRRSALARR